MAALPIPVDVGDVLTIDDSTSGRFRYSHNNISDTIKLFEGAIQLVTEPTRLLLDEESDKEDTMDFPNILAVAPSDVDDLPWPSKEIFLGGAGNLDITTVNGEHILLTTPLTGRWHRIRAVKIWDTLTTATLIRMKF
jgi:hypothetical protein